MKYNLLVAQSGGPTAAINASLCGVIEAAMASEEIEKVYGAVNGIEGIFAGRIIRLDTQFSSAEQLDLLCSTPSSALGSCRFKMPSPEQGPDRYDALLEAFRALNIGCFVYIGGNDSMDTANKIGAYCHDHGLSVRVIGVPKTIDNDLPITDHTPGFGSAAKYIAVTMQEIVRDAEIYPLKSVTIVEVMGRNAGWLTAASALARQNGCFGPQLIYLPEAPFDPEDFLKRVDALLQTTDTVVVAVSEGVRLADGSYVAESEQSGQVDAFGHKYLSGVGKYLERLVTARLTCKVRSLELSVLQRAGGHIQSRTDVEEARRAGAKAVECALSGQSQVMVAFYRVSDAPYLVRIGTAPLSEVANVERKVPREWINAEGCDVTQEAVSYLLPLIQGETVIPYENGVPAHFVFDKTPERL